MGRERICIHIYVEWLSALDHALASSRCRALSVERGPRGTDAGEEAVSRKVAAIVTAEVAGYSPRIEASHTGTLGDLKSLRRDLIDLNIDLHKGRTVKTTGDGMLAEFANGVEVAPNATA